MEEQNKSIEGKPNNQITATVIFNDLINKRKSIMSKLYESVDYNNLKFEYVDPTKIVRNSKHLYCLRTGCI